MDGTRDCVQADSEPDGGDVNRAESLLTSCDRRRKVKNPKRQPFINILRLVASFSGTDVKSYGNAFLTHHGVKVGDETFVIALTAAHVVCPTAESSKVADRTFDRRPEDIAQSLRVAIASEEPAVSSLEFILWRGQPNAAKNYGWYEVAPSWVNAGTPETAATRWSEDYAALFLKKTMLPPECTGSMFRVQDPQKEPIERSITCAGYSGDEKWAGAMLWTVGTLRLTPPPSTPMDSQASAWHTADTDRGVSGSPLYVGDGSRSKPFKVLAIHHMGAPSEAKGNPAFGYNEALPVDITLFGKLMAFPRPQGWMGESGGPNSEVYVPPVSLSETTELQDLSSLGEEDQPAQLPMTRPDNVDRIQSLHGNFHQPEQSQTRQVTTELADLAKTPNSSPVSSEEHYGPPARATHVEQRRRLSSSAPTTPCATGVDHQPVLGAKLGDHPTPASSQISQHQPGPDMTDFAEDTKTRREKHNAQLSSDSRASHQQNHLSPTASRRGVHRNDRQPRRAFVQGGPHFRTNTGPAVRVEECGVAQAQQSTRTSATGYVSVSRADGRDQMRRAERIREEHQRAGGGPLGFFQHLPPADDHSNSLSITFATGPRQYTHNQVFKAIIQCNLLAEDVLQLSLDPHKRSGVVSLKNLEAVRKVMEKGIKVDGVPPFAIQKVGEEKITTVCVSFCDLAIRDSMLEKKMALFGTVLCVERGFERMSEDDHQVLNGVRKIKLFRVTGYEEPYIEVNGFVLQLAWRS